MEKCNLLHRDISVGNILIRPTIKGWESEDGTQRQEIVWMGILSDWELAKAKDDIGQRQPERTVSIWQSC